MTQFKVGDRVKRTIADSNGFCCGDTGVITRVRLNGFCDVFVDRTGDLATSCGPRCMELIKEKTMDNLEKGDIIFRERFFERMVVLADGDYVITKDIYDGSNDLSAWTVDSLKREGYQVKGAKVELTLQEIADKFNISIDDLRIKE